MTKLIYIIGINVISFILMGWDKYCATKDYWRISETNIIGLSFLGGGIGTYLGMHVFHHKTKKQLFQITIPISILINLYIFYQI